MAYAPLARAGDLSLTLISISFSHFCERGRWALDTAKLPFTEVRTVPLLHMPVVAWWQYWAGVKRTVRADGLDKVNSKFSTPTLLGRERAGGKWALQLTDSADIVQFASDALAAAGAPPLYPADAALAASVREFEAGLARGLGPSVRAFAYHHIIASPALFRKLGVRNAGGPVMAALWALLLPLIGAGIRRGLGISAGRAERSRARIVEAFADASRRLAASAAAAGVPPEAAFLFGTSFSAADLTFAALSAPSLCLGQADGYGAWCPAPADYPPEVLELRDELAQTLAGRHAIRMFREFRRRPAGGAAAATPRL